MKIESAMLTPVETGPPPASGTGTLVTLTRRDEALPIEKQFGGPVVEREPNARIEVTWDDEFGCWKVYVDGPVLVERITGGRA